LLVGLVYIASDASHANGEAPGLMDFQVSTVFYTSVAFIVFLWIMTKFAWKPIAKMLDERAQRIKKDIADAEQAKIDAEESKRVYQDKISKVHEEAEDEARLEAKRIIERAKKDIELQKKSAEADLRVTTLENSLKIASELIKKSLTDDEHKKLAEEIISHIDEIQPV